MKKVAIVQLDWPFTSLILDKILTQRIKNWVYQIDFIILMLFFQKLRRLFSWTYAISFFMSPFKEKFCSQISNLNGFFFHRLKQHDYSCNSCRQNSNHKILNWIAYFFYELQHHACLIEISKQNSYNIHIWMASVLREVWQHRLSSWFCVQIHIWMASVPHEQRQCEHLCHIFESKCNYNIHI